MLLYFILGILFISLGIPILENIQSILSACAEYVVYTLAYKVLDIKNKIEEQKEKEKEEQEDFKIGFRQTQHELQIIEQDS